MPMRPLSSRSPEERAVLLPPASPWRLLVVSCQAGLGWAWQERLDRAAPHVYRVRQVETRDQLEAALWESAQVGQPWTACLIDTACPTLQDAPRAWYTWLACLTRPVALLDATLTQKAQFDALLELGFHALLPAWAEGGYLHFLLSVLVRPEPAGRAGVDSVAWHEEQRKQQCPACAARLPATAYFCGSCGTRLPVGGPAATRVLASPAAPVEPVSNAPGVNTTEEPDVSAGLLTTTADDLGAGKARPRKHART